MVAEARVPAEIGHNTRAILVGALRTKAGVQRYLNGFPANFSVNDNARLRYRIFFVARIDAALRRIAEEANQRQQVFQLRPLCLQAGATKMGYRLRFE
jgi:hypothetical protein